MAVLSHPRQPERQKFVPGRFWKLVGVAHRFTEIGTHFNWQLVSLQRELVTAADPVALVLVREPGARGTCEYPI